MDCIEFTVNGKKCTVNEKTPRTMSLNMYLRYVLALPGTKAMCREGGCGACVVMVRAQRPTTGLLEVFSVNSCLVLVFSCHGWDITTIEGVGNRRDGYSDIQKRFKAFNATQCGYCTPGWVMQLSSLQDKHLTEAQIERSLGSNTCRCTGYRPILDVAKSFAIDSNPKLCQKVKDIEDLSSCKTTNVQRKCSLQSCESDWSLLEDFKKLRTEKTIALDFGEYKFYKVFTEDDIFEVLHAHGTDSYMFADGNTAKGIYETFEYPRLIIDISEVKSLKEYHVDQNLVLGANVTLQDSIHIFEDIANSMNEFAYLSNFAEHFESIAHIPVRKIGSLAGNLMLKHAMPTYQSDVFLLLAAVGGMIVIRNAKSDKSVVSMSEFLKRDMQGMLILSILLPPMSNSTIFKSYKIMARNQNALAIVNAAFMLKLNPATKMIENVSIVYGNISSEFIYAENTENYLRGKHPFSNDTLQGAIKKLRDEIHPVDNPPEASPESRRKLAIGLFYKFMLNIAPSDIVHPRNKTGGELLIRPVSQGHQDFQTQESLYPLNEPVPKLEAMIQSAGEAQYVNDIPPFPVEVFGAFVLSNVYSGQIDQIDSSKVLQINGVLAVYTAKDIPGKNSFMRPGIQLQTEDEEILASSNIKFYGQPVAIVVAIAEDLAAEVAKKVKVTYKNVPTIPPVLTIDDGKKDPIRHFAGDPSIEPKGRGTDIQKIVKGVYEIEWQYHYYMEPISSLVVPVDDGIEVYDSTQWIDATQIAVAQSLGISESQVFIKSRRCGGAFGGKISRQAQVSCACALVAKKMNLPCRFILPMQTNMTTMGRRIPCQCEYEVGVDNDGKIQYLEATITEDEGCSHNESVLSYITEGFGNCYNIDNFSVKTAYVLTDLPSNTFARAPGTSEAIACIEHIMEHIAFEVHKDSIEVRKINMREEDNNIPNLIEILKKDADYETRVKVIEEFNENNRWMKKDIQISVMLFPVTFFGNYSAMVSIYRGDGTVTVTTGGIEMGQGLNTKAAQVCAYELGIPIDYISILPSMSFTAANNIFSGSSITTESVCYSIIKCCEKLKKRLEPVKDDMTNPTWKELIWKAGELLVDLTAKYMMTDQEKDLAAYSAFSVAMLETKLDVLTGRYEMTRADIIEDVGVSANPLLDIGQLEGGYVQGLGYFTSEKLVHDKHTGKLLTNRSLTYHVPLALDIPVDFRIKFLYNSNNPKGVLGAKTVGEMGICTAHGITHVLRQSIHKSRIDSGYDSTEWINIETPYTTESILTALDVKYEEFVFTP